MVVKAGIHPTYVMDEITWEEIGSILSELELLNRDSWEQTRMIMWANLQPNSSSNIELTDIITLPWDKPKHTIGEEVTSLAIEEFKKRNNIK